MTTNIKTILYNSAAHKQMIDLRNDILRKPLGLSFTPADFQKEQQDILIGAFEVNKIVGCCVLTKVNERTIQLRQMAVNNEFQGKGVGKQIVQYAEKIAQEEKYETIMMHARSVAVSFYKKLGYAIEGNEFMEVSIPHFMMKKKS
jgi:predicted GNAT family N-acyltransferase